MAKAQNGEQGAKLAGPGLEDNSTSPLSNPPSYSIKMQVSKYLVRENRFPDAVRPLSIISVAELEGDDLAYRSRLILLACMHNPGAMVRGTQRFITGEFEDEAVEFLVAAGYSRADAELIAPPGWSFQFSTKYAQRNETPEELPDSPAEDSLNSDGLRDHEDAIQGGGGFY